MNKIAIVAWREFIDTVRTRAFLFGVIIMPALIMGIIYGMERVVKSAAAESVPTRTIIMIDGDGRVMTALAERLAAYNRDNPQSPFEVVAAADGQTEAQLAELVRGGKHYAYLIVPAAAASATPQELASADAECRMGRRDGQLAASRTLRRALNDAIASVRFASAGIDSRVVRALQTEPVLAEIDLKSGAKSEDDSLARILTPFAFMFLIYMGTFGISMGLLTSVLEEKSSRVIEVLLAAISPTQLMTGKIIGITAVGVTTLAIWTFVGVSTARAYNAAHLISAYRLTLTLLYFLPALLLTAAILAAIGSACNTLKEAQSMSSPLTILNIVPMVLWMPLTEYPHSALAVALSFVPPITPFVMILRICADPGTPVWQIVVTLAVLWAAVLVAFWIAGKVFRIGILMYGQPPTIREMLRWAGRA